MSLKRKLGGHSELSQFLHLHTSSDIISNVFLTRKKNQINLERKRDTYSAWRSFYLPSISRFLSLALL